MSSKDQETTEKVRNWWSTEIIDMRPGKIRIRGEDIEELIGNISFVQMIWLMLQGKLPSVEDCLLYTSPSPRDGQISRMPSSA